MMKKRIFNGIFFVSFLVLFACMLLVMGVLYNYFGNELRSQLISESGYVAAGVEGEGITYLQSLIPGGNRITWVAADGTVLFDTDADPATMENHADHEEIAQAMETGSGQSMRHSSTLSERTMYYAQRLSDGTVLRISCTQRSIWALVLGMAPPICGVLFLAVVLSALLSSRVAKRIVEPINRINLETPDMEEDYEELAPLINRMNRQNQLIADQMSQFRRQQLEFSMITENMSEGILILDRKTDILSYNKSALSILGAQEEVRGKSAYVLSRGPEFRHAVETALEGGHCEELLECNDRVYHLLSNPVMLDSSVTGAVLLLLDVTEQQQREALRREFTSNVSHELKTPLTSIYGSAEILSNGIVKPEDVPRFARNILDESGRLITLIEDILRLSQLDENQVPTQEVEVDLYGLCQGVLDRLRPNAQERGLMMKLVGDHLFVQGVPPILEEMVSNLVDNAIKYNRDHGKILVQLEQSGAKAKLTVQDTGIGIPRESQSRVFERFYRVDKSHSKKIGGTGLGLSIVKHAVAYHHGSIALESTEGEGTCITVQLPLIEK